MLVTVVWHGSADEAEQIERALARNCVCTYDATGMRSNTCAAHHAFVTDQRFVDGLLFARHAAAILRLEEFRA